MIYLNQISMIKPYRNLPVGLTIELKDLTLLVGRQGIGKSSLLELLSKNETEYFEYQLSKDVFDVMSYYFDTESMNPRVKDARLYSNVNGDDIGIGVANALLSRWKSHGEILKEFTVNRVADAKDSILLIDEPEAALCLANQYRLAKQLKLASKSNQVIISTHSLVLIQSVRQVYDLSKQDWVSSKLFVESEISAARKHDKFHR